MLVNKLGVDVLLLMLCRLHFCKSFQSDNYVYYDLNNSALDFSYLVLSKSFLNSELVLVVKVQFLFMLYIKLIIKLDKKTNTSQFRLFRT